MSRSSLAPYSPEPVQRLLQEAAARWPDETAVVDGERRFTFAELDAYSGRFASALAAMGLGKGGIVGILAPNCAEFEIAFFGILKAGATVTTINSGYREREIAYQLQASGAQALIVHHTLADAADLALSGTEQVKNASSSRKGRMSHRRSGRSSRRRAARRRNRRSTPTRTSPRCPSRPAPPACRRA